MSYLLALLTIALLATYVQRRRSRSALWTVLVIAEAVALVMLATCGRREADPAKPYQAVFRASGYGLGQLIRQNAEAAGRVLVLKPSEAEVDQWRVDGLAKALSGSSCKVGEVLVLPLDLQSGNFEEDAFAAALARQPEAGVVVAFGGLGKRPDPCGWKNLYVLHPHGTEGMKEWQADGRLKAVIAPAASPYGPPTGREDLAQVFANFFSVRSYP